MEDNNKETFYADNQPYYEKDNRDPKVLATAKAFGASALALGILAIVALFVRGGGMLQVALALILSITGIVLGGVGKKHALHGGYTCGLAIAGQIISIIVTVIISLIFLFLLMAVILFGGLVGGFLGAL